MTWTSLNLDSRVCVQCGERYQPRQHNQRCCSRECINQNFNDIRRKGSKMIRAQLYDDKGNYIGPRFEGRLP
jgi:hypothetical protein